MSVRARNTHVIELVRKARLAHGYSRAGAPTRSSTPLPLTSTGLRMKISRGAFQDSLEHVAPKNLGGKAWLSSAEYLSAQRTWSNSGFEPLSPCVSFGWLGTQRKAFLRHDIDDCDAMVLLGAVDFDMDRVESFAPGFARALAAAKRHTAEAGTRMQGAALTSLLSYDLQQYVRPIQEAWVRNARGAANLGPRAISPEDWVSALIADSTSLCAYGYEGTDVYAESKVGSFVGLLISNTHDLLYDLATSNMMSSMMYAAAAGITTDNLHCIFVTSYMDAIAKRLCTVSKDADLSLFGDNAMIASGSWAGFSERYRTWERFVKYSRQIARSTSAKAKHIAEKAVQEVVLADCSMLNVSDTWRQVTTSTSPNLVPRATVAYVPAAAPEIAGGVLPDLCATCVGPFNDALADFASDEVRGIEGLPAGVIKCRGVARAAAIRRAAIFATGASCCDVCACRIGCWADITSHAVLTGLIMSERSTSAAGWLLQSYAVWTVMTSPVSVATMSQEEGAMGARDVLDC
ncbi:hypothetical protein DFH09DRAFT_1181804 [Mycena vulgaris]|nr:hypothetical protein DFH09DRAFT_1181804 [Mycena vulgaris]